MLRISKEQLEALGARRRVEFEDTFVRKGLDRAEIRSSVDEALRLGLTKESDVARWVTLRAIGVPLDPDILADRDLTPELKLRALEALA
ncbi:MAG TPA: hypothetical protein VGL53_18825 [Bryobacteraceae bacterium]|jgi:hypothetical protein